MSDPVETITLTEDGLQLSVTEILTGRGFITGKSGSGKSNTASVVAEELLENNFPILIIDTDGEYYGLKERYELLHVGADETCDFEIEAHHAKKVAELALEDNFPVILDVSGYLDEDRQKELIQEVVTQLFHQEKTTKKPFLLLLEEVHEFMPESGGLDELGKTLIKVAKRGRKRGLGMCAMSQRPAAVDKDFITQCDWITWHRLTWDNDTRVVSQILGTDAAETVQELDDGEALMMTDWDDQIQQVQFRRKKTFDAGATPGLGNFERPELKSVNEELVEELSALTEQSVQSQKEDRHMEDLEKQLAETKSELEATKSELEETKWELQQREAEIEKLVAARGEEDSESSDDGESATVTDGAVVPTDGDTELLPADDAAATPTATASSAGEHAADAVVATEPATPAGASPAADGRERQRAESTLQGPNASADDDVVEQDDFHPFWEAAELSLELFHEIGLFVERTIDSVEWALVRGIDRAERTYGNVAADLTGDNSHRRHGMGDSHQSNLALRGAAILVVIGLSILFVLVVSQLV